MQNPYEGGYTNCTWTAWYLVSKNMGVAMPNFGNAQDWYYNAREYGLKVGSTPKVGSVAVYDYNHVVYVDKISDDGKRIYVKEGNFLGDYNERWIPAVRDSLIGYIYFN